MSPRILATVAVAIVAGAAVLAISWMGGSGGATSGAPHRPVAKPATPAKPLPAPAGEAVLRITGVTGGNAGARTTKIDLATLEALAHESVTVYEPFLKHNVSFTGVPMSELLRRAGVQASARTMHMHALDDYKVDLPLAGLEAEGLLATRAAGKPIPIAKGGPVRLIFTGAGSLAANTDNWIWSLDSMRVGA